MVLIKESIPKFDRLPVYQSLERFLPSHEESRRHLLQLGVAGELLPTETETDLVGLFCVLDRLFATGCGHAGVKRFLSKPDRELGGRAPEDLIPEPGGVNRIQRLVSREIEFSSLGWLPEPQPQAN